MACIGSTSYKYIYVRSIYVEGAYAVEYSEIDSQSFWISERKIFSNLENEAIWYLIRDRSRGLMIIITSVLDIKSANIYCNHL